MAVDFTFIDILNMVNMFLGFLLALLALKYMKFYSQLSEWWRRLLMLTFIFILGKVVSFMGDKTFTVLMDTIFVGYFIYFLSYITTIVQEIDTAKAEMAQLKSRLDKIKTGKEE